MVKQYFYALSVCSCFANRAMSRCDVIYMRAVEAKRLFSIYTLWAKVLMTQVLRRYRYSLCSGRGCNFLSASEHYNNLIQRRFQRCTM